MARHTCARFSLTSMGGNSSEDLVARVSVQASYLNANLPGCLGMYWGRWAMLKSAIVSTLALLPVLAKLKRVRVCPSALQSHLPLLCSGTFNVCCVRAWGAAGLGFRDAWEGNNRELCRTAARCAGRAVRED